MSKIIDIEDRLKLEQKKRAKVDKAKKAEVVRKILQCTRCLARCLKCGVQFDTHEMYKRYKGPFRFCQSCQEEYDEFLRVRDAGQESSLYWYNKEWQRLWQAWLDYQQAVKDYGESPEFLDLVREVEWDR
ncbi:MAG: hypothetical protein FJ126_12435 [Deltaproteobacteria bacterium]|nr:hypothetical protein [Deltaproteobacteria bacterium]